MSDNQRRWRRGARTAEAGWSPLWHRAGGQPARSPRQAVLIGATALVMLLVVIFAVYPGPSGLITPDGKGVAGPGPVGPRVTAGVSPSTTTAGPTGAGPTGTGRPSTDRPSPPAGADAGVPGGGTAGEARRRGGEDADRDPDGGDGRDGGGPADDDGRTGGGGPERAASLAPGARIGLEPVAWPGFRVRHRDFAGRIDRIGPGSSAGARADSTFRVRTGLAGGCLSFEAVNFPGHYLRHRDFRILLQRDNGSRLFHADATFCAVAGLTGQHTSLRSFNFPDRYVDVRSSLLLQLDPRSQGSPEAMTFAVRDGLG